MMGYRSRFTFLPAVLMWLAAASAFAAVDENPPIPAPAETAPVDEAQSGRTATVAHFGSAAFRRGQLWNVEVEAAIASVDSKRHFDARLQLGRLWANEPSFTSIGVMGERTFGLGNALGVVASSTNSVTGFWGQAGALIGDSGRPGFLVGAGVSLFGVEFQRRFSSDDLPRADSFFVAKIRLPLSTLWFLTRKR